MQDQRYKSSNRGPDKTVAGSFDRSFDSNLGNTQSRTCLKWYIQGRRYIEHVQIGA
jgi:hypothetical protein